MARNITLKSRILDDKDKEILMALQEDGRMQLKDISKKVKLGIDSVHNRIKEMIKKRIFETGIFIEPRVIGYPLLVDVKIKLKNISNEQKEKFIQHLINHKRCIDLLEIMGDYDFTCVLIAKDSEDLSKISTEIRTKFKELILEWKGMLILKTHKFERYDLI